MDRSDLDERLRQIFSDLFGVPSKNIEYASNPDSLTRWDSVAHVKLIVTLEEEFSVEIPPEDQVDMLTFELVGDILTEQLPHAAG